MEKILFIALIILLVIECAIPLNPVTKKVIDVLLIIVTIVWIVVSFIQLK